ncbi:MAG: signal peptidase I [Treponema sp.]|nr:signal peptidase I [Treponema sp.]
MKQSVYDYSFEMRRQRNRRLGITFGLIISVVFFITIFMNFILFPVLVRSDSMDPDIPKNSALFITPLDRTPNRGDVVYLSRMDDEKLGAGKTLINKICEFFTLQQFYPFGYTNRMSGKPVLRRVIGIPGDTVYLKDYIAYVKPAEDSTFLTEYELSKKGYNTHIYSVPTEWDGIGSIGSCKQFTLKENEYFVLADNRIECSDSRVWGPVDASRIKGKAVLEYFPFMKFRFF